MSITTNHKIVAMPAYWASYLINGDASGISPREKDHIDRYLDAQDIVRIDDTEGEPFFSWTYDLFGGQYSGGELIHYHVEVVGDPRE